MIEIRNLTKSYEKGIKAVDNISLKINNNEIFGFLGPNGAGKTTTIKMMTGILEATEGDVFIDNYNIRTNSIEAKMNFGYIPDNPEMFLQLKGIEYLNFIADIYNVNEIERKEEIERLTNLFEISHVLNNKIESYSHGMKQKITIIGALLHKPNNLIIDEPMIGLDPKSAYILKKIMKEYAKENKAVFFSTHILEVAEKLCDKICIINKGKIIFIGTLEEMKNKLRENKSLEELFMEITNNEE